MRFTDRSRIELGWTCQRARWWGYHYQGRGLALQEEPEDLAFGGEMARQLARIKLGQSWDVKGFRGGRKMTSQQAQLVAKALLTGYEKIVWPRWLGEYELVGVEVEVPLPLEDGLVYNSRPDTLMRRKADGTLWYGPEDKTTAWVDSLLGYAGNIQLHATAYAVEKVWGEIVAGALVQGLYKGFVKQGQLYHPLTHAYVKEGIPGVVPERWEHKWQRGWERVETTEYKGGMEGWMDAHPELVAEAFPGSQPISLRRDLVEAYLGQVKIKEGEIARMSRVPNQFEINQTFPQSFSQCNEFSKSRSECQFKPLCWNPTVQKFPLSMYKMRQPHHDNERTEFERIA